MNDNKLLAPKMKIFEKIGTFIFRLLAVSAIGVSLNGLIYVGAYFIFTAQWPPNADRWPASIFYLILGLLLFRYSNPLGKLISRDLDEESKS
jgi:hypothetical protein